MSKHAKLLNRLQASPKDFTFDELKTLLDGLGYEMTTHGGSSRKFVHGETGALLMMHEPHPGNILKTYQVKAVLAHLKREKHI